MKNNYKINLNKSDVKSPVYNRRAYLALKHRLLILQYFLAGLLLAVVITFFFLCFAIYNDYINRVMGIGMAGQHRPEVAELYRVIKLT